MLILLMMFALAQAQTPAFFTSTLPLAEMQNKQVVLDTIIAQYMAGEIGRDEAMQSIYDKWEEKTEELGRDKQLAVYKATPSTDVEIAAGIVRLTDAHVRIINLSVVLPTPSPAIVDALDYATAAGVLVVAATGNEGLGSVEIGRAHV